jgi:cytosine/adenosine deaminase-related metal-dependent hydrolase
MIHFTSTVSAIPAAARALSVVAQRFVLLGDVVTMIPGQDFLRDCSICIDGNSIVAVVPAGAPLPTDFAQAPLVQTDGTIYPSLIDLHNHLTYNHIPMWTVPRKYTNRETWRTKEPLYEPGVTKPFRLLADNPDKDYRRSIVRFVECRNLFGGVSTGQGMSLVSSTGFPAYFRGLMRNVEQPLDPAFPACGGRTLNFKPGEVESILVPALRKGLPYVYHLSEGTDADARQMFLNLQLPNGTWAVSGALVCIHCVALQPQDFDILKAAAGMVWSPTSNLLLYGATADVAQAKQRGIPIALGADWAPSGCKNLLGELKVARAVSKHLGNLFSAKELVEAVTS